MSKLMLRKDLAPNDPYQLQTNALMENSEPFTAFFKRHGMSSA